MAETTKIHFDAKGQKGAIPAVGLGSVGMDDPQPILTALSAGYRMVDTALAYGNHESVGEAIRSCGLNREDVFVTTKVSLCPRLDDASANSNKVWLWDPVNTKGNESVTVDLCLEQLGLDYVDLLLVHNPTTSLEEFGAACLPHFFELFGRKGLDEAIRPDRLPDGTRLRDVLTRAKLADVVSKCDREEALATRKRTWAALERAQREGKCRYIGVSNYPAALLKEMESYAQVMPAVNQVECTPWFGRKELRDTAKDLGVALIAYGTGQTMAIRRDDATVNAVADGVGKTPMQVLLRWNYQNGMVSIPNSTSPGHIRENASIFDWNLSDEDMASLDALDEHYPLYWDPKPTLATMD